MCPLGGSSRWNEEALKEPGRPTRPIPDGNFVYFKQKRCTVFNLVQRRLSLRPVVWSIFDTCPSLFDEQVFRNRHISRFSFIFEVLLVILSGKFGSVEEVDFR